MRVDFYLLDVDSSAGIERFVCQLTGKAWHSGMNVHLFTESPTQSVHMDQQLWRWQEDRFLPHEIRTNLPTLSPITVGHNLPDTVSRATVLINLSGKLPESFHPFSRICEIVSLRGELIEQQRLRYRTYVKRGIKPNTHRIHTEGALA